LPREVANTRRRQLFDRRRKNRLRGIALASARDSLTATGQAEAACFAEFHSPDAAERGADHRQFASFPTGYFTCVTAVAVLFPFDDV